MSYLDTVDVTDEKLVGVMLREEIDTRHEASQALVVRPYPHLLKITPSQFEDLMKQAGVLFPYEEGSDKDMIYHTREGYIMEVIVERNHQ